MEIQNLHSCRPLVYANYPNMSNYVYERLGERCAESSMILPTAIIYFLILMIGLFGNSCTCIVILKNKNMHHSTNFYLFSLAISDLFLLVLGLPIELYELFDTTYPYPFGELICKGRAFITEFTSYASVLTITCFSVERWIAICFPLHVKAFYTPNRTILLMIFVWIFACSAASPLLFIVVINRLPKPDWFPISIDTEIITLDGMLIGTEFCAMDFNRPLAQRNFVFSAFLWFFLVPSILIMSFYGQIGRKLNATDENLTNNQKDHARARKSILKILVFMVMMFFLCWLPYHIQRLISVNLDSSTPQHSFLQIIFYVTGCFYYSNSACNPILYNVLSGKYRRAFCKTILGRRLTDKICKESARLTPSLYRRSQNNKKQKLFTECTNFLQPILVKGTDDLKAEVRIRTQTACNQQIPSPKSFKKSRSICEISNLKNNNSKTVDGQLAAISTCHKSTLVASNFSSEEMWDSKLFY